MKISCIQFNPSYRDVAGNIDRIHNLVHAADADLVVLPELALTGYFFKTKDEIATLAETIDGPIANAISKLAKQEHKAIISGFLEIADGHFFNSALAFDANGSLCGHYRKVHLFYFETQIFERGNIGFPVFSLSTRSGMAKVGMAICYDWRFPEVFRKLALGGAELIAVPSNIVTTTSMLHTTLRTRAFENKVALAFADRMGSETNGEETFQFRGESAIIGMNGEILISASENSEEIITTEVDLSKTGEKKINRFNDIFLDRLQSGYDL